MKSNIFHLSTNIISVRQAAVNGIPAPPCKKKKTHNKSSQINVSARTSINGSYKFWLQAFG